MRTDTGQRGFSLLEVIVALAVMGLCLSVLLRIFSSSAVTTGVVDSYYQAVNIAETRLALLVAQAAPSSSDTGVVSDRFRWETQVSEYLPDINDPLFQRSPLVAPDATFAPYLYEVRVTWGDLRQRQVYLSTIRLGPRE